MPSSMPTKPTPPPRTAKICYAWNHSPEAACPFPNCTYQHICLYCVYCANDNQIIHKDHKALYCKCRWGNGAGRPLATFCCLRLPTTTGSLLPLPALLSLKNQYRLTLLNEPYSVLTLTSIISFCITCIYTARKSVL